MLLNQSCNIEISKADNSEIFLLSILKYNASFFKRAPLHSGQAFLSVNP